MLTRLDEGQLWFSSGASTSTWRHELQVGPAMVTTPRGRFHVIAEGDGGATISCLAGRTRVVTDLREPVLLETDQMVAVSSDGTTLVVMDRELAADPLRPTPTEPRPVRRHRSRLPEAATVVALVAVLIGVTLVYGRQLLSVEQTDAPTAFAFGPVASGAPGVTGPAPDTEVADEPAAGPDVLIPTQAPGTTAALTVPVTEAPAPEAPAQAAPVTSPRGTATGRLVGCRRSSTGVVAVVDLAHRSGQPDRFTVDVALVDRNGSVYATGSSLSPVVGSTAPATVEVAVEADPATRGACELTGITAS